MQVETPNAVDGIVHPVENGNATEEGNANVETAGPAETTEAGEVGVMTRAGGTVHALPILKNDSA